MVSRLHLAESYAPANRSMDILDTTLGELMRKAASEVPDRIALVDGGPGPDRRRWTYREFVQESEAAAHALLQFFSPGERVAYLAPDSPQWVIQQHGFALAGLVMVPVNPAYTARELAYVLTSAECAGIVFAESSRGKNLRAVVKEAAAGLETLRIVPAVEIGERAASPTDRRALPAVTPDDIIQIQYTSGTTGFPKGACLHHRGVINTSRNAAARGHFRDGGVWLNAMPLFHNAGGLIAEFGCFVNRGTWVQMPSFDPGLMLELIEAERCEVTLIVPTMILAILDHPDRPRRDTGSLVSIYTGAANVPAALVTRTNEAFGCSVCNIYGLSENNGPIAMSAPDDDIADVTGTVGCPLPNVEVKIADPASGATLPLDTIGEIWSRGHQVMKGYYNQPEITARTVLPDGWLRTGDLGSMDSRGYLKITGRLKEMIIRGGSNLFPKEIEDVLFTHPAVSQVAVIGLPDEKWGEIVAAVVLSQTPDDPPAVDELYSWCRSALSPQKTPERWFFVREYPLTSTGKIQKNVLQEWIAENRIAAADWTRAGQASPAAAS